MLDSMPAELLAEIASNLNVYEVLCFTATCSAIRNACLDPLLFKALIERQHTLYDFHSLNVDRIARRMHQDASVLARYKFFELGPEMEQDGLCRWDKGASANLLRQHFGLDREIWFRYAIADYRAYQLSTLLNHLIENDEYHEYASRTRLLNAIGLQQTLQFLPHLLILKHPSIHSAGLAPAFMAQISHICKPVAAKTAKEWIVTEIEPRLAFCYAATVLSQDTPDAAMIDSVDPRAALQRFYVDRTWDAANALQSSSLSADDSAIGPTISQSTAQVLIGSFSCVLRRGFREYRIRRLIGAEYYTFILPFALDLPIAPGFDKDAPPHRLPVPFPDSFASLRRAPDCPGTLAWEDWLQAYTADLASPNFLQTGNWVGCYSYVALAPSKSAPEIDAPMRDVVFKVKDSGGVSATGFDSIGAFTLEGRLGTDGTAAGALRLRKTYTGAAARTTDFYGRMTPFGIGGVWGLPSSAGDTPRVSGSFWLWKEEWTAGTRAHARAQL